MVKLTSKINESDDSKNDRINEIFSSDILKSLDFPVTDDEGYVTGVFTRFEMTEPGEVGTNKKTGQPFVKKNAQLKFTFTAPTEDGKTMPLPFWTGTCIDGIKDDQGKYSKLVTWLIAIGGLDAKILHPRFKPNKSDMLAVIKEVYEGTFKFKTEMSGRNHVPIIDSFQLISTKDEES